MFGWLAKMLMQTPVVGSGCACCEAKREKMEAMRKELIGETVSEVTEESVIFPQSFRSGSYHAELKSDGSSKAEVLPAKKSHDCDCGGGCGEDGGCCGKCSH